MQARTLKSLVRGSLRKIVGRRPPVWRLQGEARIDGEPLRILYIGESHNRAYLQRMVFRDGAEAIPLGSVAQSRIGIAWRDFAADCDIVVLKTEQEVEALSREPFFAVPCWLDVKGATRIDTRSSSVKDDLRKIRKYQYTYEVVTDGASYDDFYHNMYLPFIRHRHEEAAMPITYEQMLEKVPRAELLRIRRDGAVVAGAMLLYGDDVVHGWKIGVRGGEESFVRQGVLSAVMLFEAQYLADRGWGQIDYGGTRAFLLDGQFQYKKKWGITLGNAWAQRFYVQPLRRSAGSVAFLAHNPFLHIADGRYRGAAFVPDAARATQQDLDRIVKDCLVAGMDSLTVYALQGDWRTSGLEAGRPDVVLAGGDRLWRP